MVPGPTVVPESTALPLDELPPGLTLAEVAERLRRYGPNSFEAEQRHLLRTLISKLTGPVPYLLEAAVVLELIAGKRIEAIIVAALIVFNGALSFVQEGRAADALSLLRSRLAIHARVRRDAHWQVIDADQLVPGDLVHIRVGDVVPADLSVISGTVSVDQSVLTGESADVEVKSRGTCYSGSLVDRGEATGEVTATGSRTFFGHTAQLVRAAKTATHLEETIFKIVWALLALDGALVVAIIVYGVVAHVPARELLPFVLILIVATVPVALPATFTLATSVGALELVRSGVLVTHLSAIEEAAAMDLLCTDKTGTITENRLSVVDLHPFGGHSSPEILSMAAAASDEATQDPIDLAILHATTSVSQAGRRRAFVPFDPATKRSEATLEVDGRDVRVMKGTPAVVVSLASHSPEDLTVTVASLASGGNRVLAVAAGIDSLEMVGLLSLGDPVRSDSPALVARLSELGVRVVMVTGDAPATAVAVARQVGIGERLGSNEDLHTHEDDEIDFDLLAGVLPEDKLMLVERGQRSGHVVGMTGDGVNDAPALKRAEVGIAVSNATDVAKDAASLVLTSEGLSNVVAAVETGRRVYQRMLTYTLNKIAKTFQVSLFLGLGLLATGSFVTTPRLVLLLLFANDFVTMSLATDRVGFSPGPDRWQIPALSVASLGVAIPWLLFAFGTFFLGRDVLGLSLAPAQTLVFVMLVATGQATIYLVRERRHLWSSRPSVWMLGATTVDLILVTVLATRGILMAAVSIGDVGSVLAAVLLTTFILDFAKGPLLSKIRSDAAPSPDRPLLSPG